MFVGWWWLYCTLFIVVYRSSLIAHLSVPGTANAIDSFEQMLDEGGWTWGYEPSYGSGWEWFKTNTNPIIKRIYEGMEVRIIMEFLALPDLKRMYQEMRERVMIFAST